MDITRKIFERAGYTVHCAVGAAGAQDFLADFWPDGILLDMDLPDGNGLALCAEIRLRSSVPIMFTSTDKEDEIPALHCGANDYLKKPYDYGVMQARIEAMLRTRAPAPGRSEAEGPRTEASHAAEDSGGAGQVLTLAIGESVSQSRLRSGAAAFEEAGVDRMIRYKVMLWVAACTIFTLAGTLLYQSVRDKPRWVAIEEGAVPLGSLLWTDEDAKPYAGSEPARVKRQGWLIPDYDEAVVTVNQSAINMPLFNPDGNPCCLTFEFILTDTGESLYASGLVWPGTYIDGFEISGPLGKGEHSATLIIKVYPMSGSDEWQSVEEAFTLSVG